MLYSIDPSRCSLGPVFRHIRVYTAKTSVVQKSLSIAQAPTDQTLPGAAQASVV